MPYILALDTSTEACSCALIDIEYSGDHHSIIETFSIIPRMHADKMLGMIENTLISNKLSFKDIRAIAYGRGPGSFTGLRIASGITQGLAYGLEIPVIGISTLAALAWQGFRNNNISLQFACLDARIQEVYWSAFSCKEGTVLELCEESLSKPAFIDYFPDDAVKKCSVVGSGLNYIAEMPTELTDKFTDLAPELYPSASDIAYLALNEYLNDEIETAFDVRPIYLRDKVTQN